MPLSGSSTMASGSQLSHSRPHASTTSSAESYRSSPPASDPCQSCAPLRADGGHNVPGGPPLADVIKRCEGARDVERMIECRGHRRCQPMCLVLRNRGKKLHRLEQEHMTAILDNRVVITALELMMATISTKNSPSKQAASMSFAKRTIASPTVLQQRHSRQLPPVWCQVGPSIRYPTRRMLRFDM